ncbi:MAG: oligosaccharide flippase family protein [Candidatus Aenigmarchaeota archaeon]|nr:oligosaccharide flippase family protein [Candidatus Aenigmarchaeota archaeon]
MKARIKAMLKSEFFINSGMVFGASILGALFMFVSNIILSRLFGPSDFGMYKTVIGLFMFIATIIDFGAYHTLTKYIAEFLAKKQKQKINYLIRFFLFLKFSVSFIVGGLAYLFRSDIARIFLKSPSLEYLIFPGVILSVLFVFDLSKSVVMGFQKFKLLSASNFITTASTGIATVFLGYYYGIYWAIIGWALGYLIGNLINFKFMLDKGLLKKVDRFDIKPILKKYSFPMWGMYALTMSNTAIIPVLSLFFTPVLIGYYGLSWTFYSGLLLIPIAFSQVLFPKIAQLQGDGNIEEVGKELKKAFLLYTPVVIVGICGTLLFSHTILSLIAPAYLAGLKIFKVLNIAGLVLGYLWILSSYYGGLGKVKKSVLVIGLYNLLLLGVSFVILWL